MEPETEKDIWKNHLAFNSSHRGIVERYKGNMSYDLGYQIIMARMLYLRDSQRIPSDPLEAVRYYKRVWNTLNGKATVKLAFRKYVFLCV